MAASAFLPSALAENRAGRLDADQLRDLRLLARRRSAGLFGRLLYGRDDFSQDVEAARVESAAGAITKRSSQWIDPLTAIASPGREYRIVIASRESGNVVFKANRELHDAAPDAGFVRLFYLPRSRLAVNLELLQQDSARDVSAGSVEQALGDWRAARDARDKVGEAQARAGLAELSRELESWVGGDVPASSAVDPATLARQIVGRWSSPFMAIQVRDDGTLEMSLAGGDELRGSWSVDPEGRLQTDAMGMAMTLDAHLAGDELTLVIQGQAMRLRRADAG